MHSKSIRLPPNAYLEKKIVKKSDTGFCYARIAMRRVP